MTATTDAAGAELRANPWTAHAHEASTAKIGRMVRAMPGFARIAVTLAWRCSRTATVTIVVLQMLSATVTVFGLFAVAQLLTEVLTSGQVGERLLTALPALALVAGSYVVRGLADAGVAAAQARLSPGVRRLAEQDLVAVAADVELVCFDDPDFHDALIRARDRGARSIDRAVVQLVELTATAVSLVAVTVAIGILSPALIPLLAVSVLPAGWATVRNARIGYAMFVRTMATRRRLSRIAELLTERDPAAEVRAYTAQPFLLAEHRGVATSLERTEVRLGWRQTRIQLVGRALSGVGAALAYAVLAWLVVSGGVSVSNAGAAVIAMHTGRAALSRAALMVNLLYEHSLYVRDFGHFLRNATARRPAARPRTTLAGPRVVDVVAVSFRYPGAPAAALREVSLTLQRGQVVALVGENGSGKSTLAKLLAGLYAPDTGVIAWDGVDLAEVEPDTVRSRVALILQEATHWPFTIEQNVTIGRPPYSGPGRIGLDDAARASGAADVVAALPAGWNTLLSKEFKGGTELSVGQWQRIAVARALYRDAPMLICDEPTAPLDARAEARVYDTLRRLAGGRTVVLITHRLASVRLADHIVVLRAGRIAERGTHDELMARGGHYAELYELQALAYR